jgi:hypothetical protein
LSGHACLPVAQSIVHAGAGGSSFARRIADR